MAVPILRRKSNNEIMSDKCIAWSGWYTPYGMVEIPTVTLVPYLQNTGHMTVRCQATFRFRSDYPNSDIDKYFDLMELIAQQEEFLFRDLEGWTTTVKVSKPPAEPGGTGGFNNSNSRLRTSYEVPLELLKNGYIEVPLDE